MDLKLLYFYSPSCGACKDYLDVVDRLSTAFNLTLQKQNIDEIDHSMGLNGSNDAVPKPQYKLDGIPTLILENNGVEIWRSIGNVPFQQVYKDLKDYV